MQSWEARVRAMVVLTGALRRWNIDVFRHAIERLPPVDYLGYTYFEKWFDAMIAHAARHRAHHRGRTGERAHGHKAPRLHHPLSPPIRS